MSSSSSFLDNKNKPAEEEEVDIDLTDPEVGKAAVKIQSNFKKFMANKKGDGGSKAAAAAAAAKAAEAAAAQEAKEMEKAIADIDLNEPEVEKAAIKIQSTFRGYKTRKENGVDTKVDS